MAKKTRWIVMGQHPDAEKSVSTGVYYDYRQAIRACETLEYLDWITEIIELESVRKIMERG